MLPSVWGQQEKRSRERCRGPRTGMVSPAPRTRSFRIKCKRRESGSKRPAKGPSPSTEPGRERDARAFRLHERGARTAEDAIHAPRRALGRAGERNPSRRWRLPPYGKWRRAGGVHEGNQRSPRPPRKIRFRQIPRPSSASDAVGSVRGRGKIVGSREDR